MRLKKTLLTIIIMNKFNDKNSTKPKIMNRTPDYTLQMKCIMNLQIGNFNGTLK